MSKENWRPMRILKFLQKNSQSLAETYGAEGIQFMDDTAEFVSAAMKQAAKRWDKMGV